MAAGLTVPRERYDAFAQAFAAEIAARAPTHTLTGTWLSDGALASEDLRLEVARRIRDAGPWGAGFPEPVFDGEFEVIEHRTVGGRHARLRLASPEHGPEVEAIAFRFAGAPLAPRTRVHVVFRLDVNRYRGQDRLQLVIEHLQVAVTGPL
jgi:single-stranded-DNA-specific exonuclease